MVIFLPECYALTRVHRQNLVVAEQVRDVLLELAQHIVVEGS